MDEKVPTNNIEFLSLEAIKGVFPELVKAIIHVALFSDYAHIMFI